MMRMQRGSLARLAKGFRRHPAAIDAWAASRRSPQWDRNVRGKPDAAFRLILAVIVAGIVGTVANSVIVAALTPNESIPLAVSPGGNAVAIGAAVLLPVIYAMTSGAVAAVIAVGALTLIPSLLAQLVFGIGAPWLFVLGVNAAYAVAAWAAYLAVARTRISWAAAA